MNKYDCNAYPAVLQDILKCEATTSILHHKMYLFHPVNSDFIADKCLGRTCNILQLPLGALLPTCFAKIVFVKSLIQDAFSFSYLGTNIDKIQSPAET